MFEDKAVRSSMWPCWLTFIALSRLEPQYFWSGTANLGLWQSCDGWIAGVGSMMRQKADTGIWLCATSDWQTFGSIIHKPG